MSTKTAARKKREAEHLAERLEYAARVWQTCDGPDSRRALRRLDDARRAVVRAITGEKPKARGATRLAVRSVTSDLSRDSETLKPCPFCGSEAFDDGDTGPAIMCSAAAGVGCPIYGISFTRKDWNRRYAGSVSGVSGIPEEPSDEAVRAAAKMLCEWVGEEPFNKDAAKRYSVAVLAVASLLRGERERTDV